MHWLQACKLVRSWNVAAWVLLGAAAGSLIPGSAWAQAQGKAPAKGKRGPAAGLAIKENKATPIERITAAKGFRVELLYSVPMSDQGSWVNLCVDPQGRILVSDQYGGLYRCTPPPPGQTLNAAQVARVPAEIRAVNGMVWAFGALYVGVNDYESKIKSGLYRITDSDGDDQLDRVELLRAMEAKGDHGVHAVVPAPDGKSLFLVCGNSTKPTETAAGSPVPRVWGEDHLLPRLPDGRGFMRDALAPGGIIYRVSPDGQLFEAYASGFRNVFDAAFNRAGDLFTYDADMEYDFNTSWYRPTRICQATSGAEFGWRNGAGKRPDFYVDTLPPVLDIGPGSPTGMTFGYGAKFPAKYQQALYALDWSWGKLYAVHLEPHGASYKATKEEFVTGAPLPITDAVIHPADGAMYFTIGGRRVQSGLYRVTYVGDESTAPVEAEPTTTTITDAAALRRRLESFHGRVDADAVAASWEALSHPDRFVRWAARTALEHQPRAAWTDRALREPEASRRIQAVLALTQVAGVCPPHRTESTPAVDGELGRRLSDSLLELSWPDLSRDDQLAYVRTAQIVFNRFGPIDEAARTRWLEKLEPAFPAGDRELNWLLCETLVYLQSATAAAKGIALLSQAPTQEEQIEYARSLRMLRAGWTPETRREYLEWFLKAANFRGGASFEKFVEFVRNDAVATLSDSERTMFAELLARKVERESPLAAMSRTFAGRTPKEWTLDELATAAADKLKNRDFTRGRRMFAAAACFSCHRFANEGGMTGPDLTSAGRRYSARDLLEQVLHPSKEINEQFSAIVVETDAGKTYSGVVVNLNGDNVVLNTDLTDPNERVTVDRKKIERMERSPLSPMPTGLLNLLTLDEILDLTAYLASGGDPHHRAFMP
ncbi:MAG: c-type cytochrome [Pirellulales bacterium]